MKLSPEYAQWETEGGTTLEQNENRPQHEFTHPELDVPDARPGDYLELGEADIQAEIT